MSLLLLLAASAIPVAPVQPEKTFSSWTVACDNLRDCAGVGGIEQAGDGSAWVIHFTRRSGADAEVLVEAFPAFQESDPGPVNLRIDGKKTAFGFDSNGGAVGGAESLLAAIAAARTVEVIDKSGKQAGLIPVSGASAALRWVDDRQGRASTVTALVAKGAKPASAVPPPPEAPRITVPPASSAAPKELGAGDIERIKRLSEYCDSDTNPDWVPTYYRLDARSTLALVPCGMDAYQGNSLVLVIDEQGKWTPATIECYEPPYPESAPSDAFILTEADWDPDNRLLLTMARGRGINDCGMGASWAWEGTMFRLARYEALNTCIGAPPGTWLPRWHTANDPLADQ